MSALAAQPDQNAIEPRALRNALSKFATGVTVVTAMGDNGPVGVTVNSFSSVSLDPPLVLWSLGKRSNRLSVFERTNHYAVHVLSQAQHGLCDQFTREANAFDAENLQFSDHGVPLIEDCLARFEASRHAIHQGGDHLIFVAEVSKISVTDSEPLIFFEGAFGGFKA